MLDRMVENVGLIIRDKDIHKLAKNGSKALFKLLFFKDIAALPDIFDNAIEAMEAVPNIIFADKMYRFLTKTYSDYETQIKFAEKFEKDDKKFCSTIKKQLQLLDKIEFDEKIDWFANLTRAVCLDCIDIDKYLRLSTAVSMLMVDDLKLLKNYYGKKDIPETPTLSNYFAYGLTKRKISTECGGSTAEHTLSVSGIELLKYSVEYENCEQYQLPKEGQDGDGE